MTVSTNSAIGGRLKLERVRLRLSQAEIARRGGLTIRTYGRYELGTSSPSAAFLAVLCANGFDVLYVISGIHSTAALTSDESVLLDEVRSLDEHGRFAVRHFVNGLLLRS
ncbi:helix-turn-helix domain-containing protein [Chitinimonas koreensis]|uniref:helix-turn-helix domain-containing protein n=1 Tax=Chitinimonas koreensis TaxID=356302 RepID=UPI0009FF3702|nr:helix-turn-helix transcriptional regulator [Chitinimonas koreensis]